MDEEDEGHKSGEKCLQNFDQRNWKGKKSRLQERNVEGQTKVIPQLTLRTLITLLP
jgi:hypothetical protein